MTQDGGTPMTSPEQITATMTEPASPTLADEIAARIIRDIRAAALREQMGEALVNLLALAWRLNSGEVTFPELDAHPAVSAAMAAVRRWEATAPEAGS